MTEEPTTPDAPPGPPPGEEDDGPPELGSPRQERFVHEYLKDLNATQAAVRAGYSPRSAAAAAGRLAALPHVRARMRAARDAYLAEARADAARVVRELAVIAFSDVTAFAFDPETGDLVPPEHSPEAARAVASFKRRSKNAPGGREVEVSLQLWNKLEALKLLGQYVGLFEQAGGPQAPSVLVLKGVDAELALGARPDPAAAPAAPATEAPAP